MTWRGYRPSGHPEQCKNVFTVRQPEISTQAANLRPWKVECKRKAVWVVGKLRLCHICYERYITRHPDIDITTIIRLSDDERDFVEHFRKEGKGESVYQ